MKKEDAERLVEDFIKYICRYFSISKKNKAGGITNVFIKQSTLTADEFIPTITVMFIDGTETDFDIEDVQRKKENGEYQIDINRYVLKKDVSLIFPIPDEKMTIELRLQLGGIAFIASNSKGYSENNCLLLDGTSCIIDEKIYTSITVTALEYSMFDCKFYL